MRRILVLTVFAAASFAARPQPATNGDLNALLDRVDKAGSGFRAMSANVRRVQHTAVVNEDTIDSGVIFLKRGRGRDVRMLIDLTQPDPKQVEFQGHTVEIYYPKINTIDEFDVSKQRELLEQLFLLGFGSSRAELQSSYTLRLVGPDTLAGQKTQVLELIPKSNDVRQHLSKIEMWVGGDGYPLQQKFYQKGGDYELATYSDVKINPDLPESSLKLKAPKNAKRDYPQK